MNTAKASQNWTITIRSWITSNLKDTMKLIRLERTEAALKKPSREKQTGNLAA